MLLHARRCSGSQNMAVVIWFELASIRYWPSPEVRLPRVTWNYEHIEGEKMKNIPRQEYTPEYKKLSVKRAKAGQTIGAVAKDWGL